MNRILPLEDHIIPRIERSNDEKIYSLPLFYSHDVSAERTDREDDCPAPARSDERPADDEGVLAARIGELVRYDCSFTARHVRFIMGSKRH